MSLKLKYLSYPALHNSWRDHSMHELPLENLKNFEWVYTPVRQMELQDIYAHIVIWKVTWTTTTDL